MLRYKHIRLLIVLLFSYCLTISAQTTLPDIVCPGQTKVYYVTYHAGSNYIWWINGILQRGHNSNKFLHTWEVADTFLLEVQEISMAGCAGKIQSGKVIVSNVTEPVIKLIIPNAFSPNGDMINDTWVIKNTEIYPKTEITIYNRWGQTVWRSERGYPLQWDGKNNRGLELPVDSYHYIIDLHNGMKVIIGSVTIIK